MFNLLRIFSFTPLHLFLHYFLLKAAVTFLFNDGNNQHIVCFAYLFCFIVIPIFHPAHSSLHLNFTQCGHSLELVAWNSSVVMIDSVYWFVHKRQLYDCYGYYYRYQLADHHRWRYVGVMQIA